MFISMRKTTTTFFPICNILYKLYFCKLQQASQLKNNQNCFFRSIVFENISNLSNIRRNIDKSVESVHHPDCLQDKSNLQENTRYNYKSEVIISISIHVYLYDVRIFGNGLLVMTLLVTTFLATTFLVTYFW